jgi:hypothetical protein
MKLIIELEFGNDAMQHYSEARTAIRNSLGMSAHRAKPEIGDAGTFRDLNGNRVGKWYVVDGEAS